MTFMSTSLPSTLFTYLLSLPRVMIVDDSNTLLIYLLCKKVIKTYRLVKGLIFFEF